MIEVRWSAARDEDFCYLIIEDHTTMLPPYSAIDGETAISDICEDYFGGEEIWDEQWGPDETHATITIRIAEPASIAGFYEVELSRVIRARARKRGDKL